MPSLVWDRVGDRNFDHGLDRAVLYLQDGRGIAWSGVTSVVERASTQAQSVYYDGRKISEIVAIGSFSASLRAVTYPDEFEEVQGSSDLTYGVRLGEQMPQLFGLCYRSTVGNDIDPDASHKIHILYNLIAIPSETAYATISADPSLVEFEWEIRAIPEDIPGHRPTAHITIDTAKLDPWMVEDLEEKLYGGPGHQASLVPMPEMIAFLRDWARVSIVDNHDGTWTATASRQGLIRIFEDNPDLATLVDVDATYIDDERTTYRIRSTRLQPAVKVVKNGDGTWTAISNYDGQIEEVSGQPGLFEIHNAEVTVSGPDWFRIKNPTP
jgi:hypothetical protein